MNRCEHRAQWLARYRAAAGQELRDSHDQQAERAGSHAAIRLVSPVSGAVRLHIEEVFLHGFNPHGRYAISGAIRQEFIGLLTERGVPSALGAATVTQTKERLDAGAFGVAPGSRPQTLGAQVAQALYGGLKR